MLVDVDVRVRIRVESPDFEKACDLVRTMVTHNLEDNMRDHPLVLEWDMPRISVAR